MSKTKQTLEIEQALIKRTSGLLGCYGALEVTIGCAGSSGYERCDYVEFDTSGEIRCYEIKVTMRDLKSKRNVSIGERVELLEGIAKSACRGASKYYLAR